MSIASEITRLQSAKSTLKTKLNAKNDEQHQIDDETIDEYGDFVDSIVKLHGTTLTATPTTSQQSFTPTSPNNGYTSVTVNAVTSAIDNNITAGNIKKNVEILGVTGSYEGSGGGEANIFAQTTEPETKKGIWLQANRTIEHIYGDDEIFIAGTWEADGKYANIPYNFYDTGRVATIGTDVYLFGGGGYYNQSAYKYAYKFDTLTNNYTRLTDIPAQMSGYYHVVAVGNDIYIILNNIMYKYNISTNSYTSITPIQNHSISYGSSAVIGTDIFIFGNNDNSNYYRTVSKYDTLTNTTTQLTNMPMDWKRGGAVAIGTDIFLFGGDAGTTTKRAYKYDTLTGTATRLTDVPVGIDGGYVSQVVTAIGTDVYIIKETSAYKYDTLTDTYTQLTSVPYTTYVSTIVQDKIFCFSGYDQYTRVQCLPLESSTYQNNSVVIAQGKYYTVGYGVELYNDSKVAMPLYYAFADAWFYTTANGIETNIPTYYGDGTNWIKIKN